MDRIYEPGTNTLVTSWKTPTGWVVVRDALTMGPRRGEDTVTPHTRPPFDQDADHALVRTATCIDGKAEIDLVCEPAFDYGRVAGEWTLSADRHRAEGAGAGQSLVMQTDMLLGIEAGRARARRVLQRRRDRLLRAGVERGRARARQRRGGVHSSSRLRRRSGATGSRARRSPTTTLGPLIQRAALTIKGLTYMPTGASVAALTTSLPETPGGERNWDYRYTWIRDSTFLLRALHYLLLDWEADEFMQFIADLDRNDDGALQIMYGIDGRRDLTESVREDLSGYGGARPSGSATAPSSSVRTTSSGLRWTPSCCTAATASASRGGSGRSWRRRPTAPRPRGAGPTRASGRRAASRGTTSPRS